MKKYHFILSSTLITLLSFSACATNDGPEVDASAASTIQTVEVGKVLAVRGVVVKGDGMGTFLGALAGAVIGSTMGAGDGKTLMALGGGLAGAYAGKEVSKANAEELTVQLDSGATISIIIKDHKYLVGDRIQINKDGNKVTSTQRLSN